MYAAFSEKIRGRGLMNRAAGPSDEFSNPVMLKRLGRDWIAQSEPLPEGVPVKAGPAPAGGEPAAAGAR